jgi:hypothetical protein
MTELTELTERVDIDVPGEAAWAALTDWERQGEWILATTVRVVDGGQGVGTRLAAFTGFGPAGFTDSMEVTRFEPPLRCEVRHTGKLVRGEGLFEVLPRGGNSCTFVWSERFDLPFGLAGWAAWQVARFPLAAGIRLSLRRFARFAKAYAR